MTTTDRELLQRAAKAAGHRIEGEADKLVVFPGHFAGGFSIYNELGGSSLWNPLTDDGDALRLAVKLRIEPHFVSDLVQAVVLQGSDIGEWETVLSDCQLGDDPYAATRRAIVRAAAAMAGKGE